MAGIPDREVLQKFVVFREGWEVIRQSLYDYQLYPAAGSSQLTFFAVPVGQGTTVQGVGVAGAATKSLSDTNLLLAGQLSANKEFLVESIEVPFYPTVYHVTNAVNNPATVSITTAAVLAANLVNDEYIFRKSGNLQFVVGSKPYLTEAPMARFPAKTTVEVTGSMSGWIGATLAESYFDKAILAKTSGRPYMLKPAAVLLPSNQSFSVTLSWPEGLQAITSAAKVGVILDGYEYRRSQ